MLHQLRITLCLPTRAFCLMYSLTFSNSYVKYWILNNKYRLEVTKDLSKITLLKVNKKICACMLFRFNPILATVLFSSRARNGNRNVQGWQWLSFNLDRVPQTHSRPIKLRKCKHYILKVKTEKRRSSLRQVWEYTALWEFKFYKLWQFW
jgi:hypothetical protein